VLPQTVRRRAGATVGWITAKEARIRQDHAHKVSRRLVDTYDVICLVDLRIANRVRTARDTVDAPGTKMAQKAGLKP
jgi:putative transposase